LIFYSHSKYFERTILEYIVRQSYYIVFEFFLSDKRSVQLMSHISTDIILSLLSVVHDSLPYHNVDLGSTF